MKESIGNSGRQELSPIFFRWCRSVQKGDLFSSPGNSGLYTFFGAKYRNSPKSVKKAQFDEKSFLLTVPWLLVGT